MATVETLTNEAIALRRTNAALELAAIREVDDYAAQFKRLQDQTHLLLQVIRMQNSEFTVDTTIDPPAESEWLTEARARVATAETEALGGLRLGYSD
jgi:hypothetical protein